MSIWASKETGESLGQSDGSAELGNNLDPIPAGTKLKAAITEAGWKIIQDSDEQFIELRWDVMDGEHKGRVLFQKVRVYLDDAKKADKHRRMFAAIDANCGGKLMAKGDDPSDFDLATNLCNKLMFIVVGVWEQDGKSGNWIMGVSSTAQEAANAATANEDIAF